MDTRDPQLSTHFAPAGRDSTSEIWRKKQIVEAVPLLQQTIDTMPDLVLILNGNRQIVSANRTVLETLACNLADVVGKRPGELIRCHNAMVGPDGCGTAEDCMTCGAVNAILECQASDQRVMRECRICLEEPVGGALDLKAVAAGVDVQNERFTICVLKDISDEKRLAVLARLFFHDLMNTAGGIQGYAELIREEVPANSPEEEDLRVLSGLADQLVDEICAQRDLTYAESGELELECGEVSTVDLLHQLQAAYSKHPVALERKIVLGDLWQGAILSDQRLLARVLGNMIKNALEAIDTGQTVSLHCREQGDEVVFSVHNPTVMPAEVQAQIFQRSFSTKAAQGRGIGTHSVKLLGERYLRGKVWFTSTETEGTTFSLCLAKSGPSGS
jgi:nitrogen fixation/metabolism regulation signal transduction histidine kinase